MRSIETYYYHKKREKKKVSIKYIDYIIDTSSCELTQSNLFFVVVAIKLFLILYLSFSF